MAVRGNDYFAKSLSILRNRDWGFSVRNEHEQEETERTEDRRGLHHLACKILCLLLLNRNPSPWQAVAVTTMKNKHPARERQNGIFPHLGEGEGAES